MDDQGPTEISIDTQHDDMVHDAQLDYYGKRLATCSSDRLIKIFDNIDGRLNFVCNLNGHNGPVWQVAWAHPKYGNLLASASYDGQVLVHRETKGSWQPQEYQVVFTSPDNQSYNSIAWGPPDDGLVLAAAGSDGYLYIKKHESNDGWTEIVRLRSSTLGTNAVSWAPYSGSLEASEGEKVWRLTTGSCDNEVRVWTGGPTKRTEAEWTCEVMEDGHKDWVRDVAWAPNTGLAQNIIASAGEDGKVFIWTQQPNSSAWKKTLLPLEATNPAVPVWRVSWSITGNILAVSSGDQKVTLWKQRLNGDWAPWQEANGGEWKKVNAS